MGTRKNKLVLLFIAFTLAVTPLRGAFAQADDAASSTEAESHCAQMQVADTHPPEHRMGQPGQDKADPAGHSCDQDCDGTCCDGSCNACTHGVSTALNAAPAFAPVFAGAILNTANPGDFPKRSLPPPLHPPATLHS